MSIESATELSLKALTKAPAGLFTDFDGTISHIADTPSGAALAGSAGESLGQLARSLSIVAIVTGRSATDAAALVGVPDLMVIGNHGMERVSDGVRSIDARASGSIEAIASILDHVQQTMADLEESKLLVYENKELTGSIHYRRANDTVQARQQLLDAISSSELADDLSITEGRLVIEVRPKVDMNKGIAIEQLVTELGLRGAVFLGDDVTDVDGFRLLRELSDSGVDTVSVGVVSEETNPVVAEESDVTIHGVDEAVELLELLAAGLKNTGVGA